MKKYWYWIFILVILYSVWAVPAASAHALLVRSTPLRSVVCCVTEPQPDPGGIWLIQYGVQNYLNLRPAADAGDCDGLEDAVGAVETSTGATQASSGDDDGGGGSGAMIGIGVAAALVVLGGAFFLMRRRATVDDRE